MLLNLQLFAQQSSIPIVKELAPKVFNAMLNVSKGATIIDVQTAQQFVEAHISSAYPAPEKDDLIKIMASIDKSKRVFIYCRYGERSDKASKILIQNGFLYVYELKGGLDRWIDDNFEVEDVKIDKE